MDGKLDPEKAESLVVAPESGPTPDDELASEDEIRDLNHVADSLPTRVWLAALIGMAERFGYYGTQSVFQNYLQHSPSDLIPGAVGLGKSLATTVNSAFIVLIFILPLPTSILVDARLGRYRALQIFTVIYALGSAILFATSFPFMMRRGIAASGFIPAVVLIAIGLGGVQASLQPFIADQYTEQGMRIKTLKNGRRVVVDRELTIQYIYNLYFWMVNVGSLGSVATTLMEKYIGFWSAYLLDLCAVILCAIMVQLAGSKFVHPPPHGSVLPKAFRCLGYAIQDGFSLDAALPENQLMHHGRRVPWDNHFIDELRNGLSAVKICISWPIFWLCMAIGSQVSVSQAGQMETHGIPNDLIKSINPIAYVFFGFLVQKILYPFLNKRRIAFRMVDRITLGFILMAVSMGYAAGVQGIIYHAGPCYRFPLSCEASEDGTVPNRVHVLLQLPVYAIIALAEVFCWPTASEYVYTQAPRSMKSVLQACYISTAGLGYALGMALSPLARDPFLVVLWGLVAGLMLLTACAFRVAFRRY